MNGYTFAAVPAVIGLVFFVMAVAPSLWTRKGNR